MRSSWLAMGLVAVLVGCAGNKAAEESSPSSDAVKPGAAASLEPLEGRLVAAGSLRKPVVIGAHAIVVPKGADATALREAIVKAAESRGYVLGAEPVAKGGRGAMIEIVAPPEVGVVPGLVEMRGRELSESDVQGILAATQAIGIGLAGPAAERDRILHDLAALAQTGGAGWIIDTDTREFFPRAEFAEARPPEFPVEMFHVVSFVVSEDDDGSTFVETLGMGRLGLPELMLDDIPMPADEAVALLTAAAQTLIERESMTADGRLTVDVGTLRVPPWPELAKALKADGGSGTATLIATWSAGHEEDPMIRLAADGDAKMLRETLASFAGGQRPPIDAPADDAELLAASKRARQRLAEIAKKCAKGLARGEQLAVKAPLETSDGTEYAWVAVEKCHAGRFEGELLNDPHGASKLRAGAKIEVPLADAYDYDYTRADGTTEGNETTKILQARQR